MENVNRWDALPEECKSMILARLSTKEIARIARISKEFWRAVNVLRSSVHLLVLPPTLSISALEGMVHSHRNVKSLSFKRCGAKLKSFVPIIKAAAAGSIVVTENDSLDSVVIEKRKRRSLTSIDFRNCMNLIDTDVSILCSLHSRLEEVDLTNCPFMSDASLLTLSRYQSNERQSDPLEKYNCYPRYLDKSSKVSSDTFTEEEELFLKNNDAAVYEEIQGLGLTSPNFRSWPRIGERSRKESSGSHIQVSSRKYEEGKIAAASPYSNVPRRADLSAATSPTMGLRKSYAQVTAKVDEKSSPCSSSFDFGNGQSTAQSLEFVKPAEMDLPLPFVEDVHPASGKVQTNKPADLDPALTFIDWGLNDVDSNAGNSDSQILCDARLFCGSNYRPTSSTPDTDVKLESEIATTNRYRDMYKHYVIDDVQSSTRALPDLIDKFYLSPARAKDSSQGYRQSTVSQVDDSGTKYRSAEMSISDSQMMRTQRNFFTSNSHPSVEGNNLSKHKTVCIAGGFEIRDQRVQLDPSRKVGGGAPHDRTEAFCRTVNHVGIFAIPSDSKIGYDRTNLIDNCDGVSTSNSWESRSNSRLGDTEDSSRTICLPDVTNVGGVLRRNTQPLLSPDSYAETSIGLDRGGAGEIHVDMLVDGSSGYRGLISVSVACCPEITDRGVQALLKGTSRTCLSTLDVSRCAGITSAGLKLPARSGLQHLIAVQMPGVNRIIYQLPVQSVLQHLNLAGCHKLEELLLVALSLKTLNLSNCKKLTRLHLKCPSLTALNLSLCDGLERFIKFQCSALKSANFLGCRMLSQSALSGAIDSSAGLEDLKCGGCDRVERLDLVQASLLTLDVSGSQSLKRLFCKSKVLRIVDACGCKTLAEVYLYSAYLRRMLFSNCALLQILVIPLDAIKDTIDATVAESRRTGSGQLDELEIAISGCNMPETVKRNLAKLTKQWHSCFKSTK